MGTARRCVGAPPGTPLQTMRELLTNILLDTAEDCDLFKDFCEEVAAGHRAKIALAQERQERMARARQGMVHNEHLGERLAVVDPSIYWEMVRLYGRDCWSDEGFLKDMLRDNPAMRVRDERRTTTIIRP